MKGLRLIPGICMAVAIIFSGCIKRNYEGPPNNSNNDPKLPVNSNIAKVLGLLPVNYPNAAVAPVRIDSDWTITAKVIADDRSGNLYKQIVIDDDTTGLALLLDAYSLYNEYPVGRKIYIHLKGLYIGTYHSLPQLGYTPDNTGAISGIPSTMIGNFIVKANFPVEVTPVKVTLAQIAGANVALENRLIEIDDVEFAKTDVFLPFADPAPATGTSRTIDDCSQNIVLRSSGYANFQPFLTPAGKGKITAIYTVYNSTPQLVLRDTSDIKFYNARCDGYDPNKTLLNETFQSVTANNATLSISNWTNFAEVGGIQYKGGILGSSLKFAKISAFGTSQAAVKSWLISPAVNLENAVNPVLTFKSNDGYDNGASFKVYVSSDYSGSGDPNAATWTALTGYTLSTGHSSGYGPDFISSGPVSLSAFSGKIYIAFKYEGSDPDYSTTFEIDDVTVTKD